MTDANSQTAHQSSDPSRREFLIRAGVTAGGLALLGIPELTPRLAAAAVDQRTYAGGNFLLELDGQSVDFLKSTEGGFPRGEVVSEPAGPNPIVKKHIGQPKYQDIAIQCDPALPKPLFDWIAATLNLSYIRKNGAVITADFNYAEQSRLQFNNALITEFGVPTCDGASKEPGYFTVKFSPEFTTVIAGKGSAVKQPFAKTQKMWPSSNFRLTIPGLDCSRVSKIDAFTIKQKEPGKLEFPNLSLYVAEAFAGTFYAWLQEMVVKGNTGENNEKPGTLELLDPSLKPILTIYLHHLGIFGFAPEKPSAGVDTIRRVKVEMYCEQMTLLPLKG